MPDAFAWVLEGCGTFDALLHAADAAGRTAAHLAASAGSEELIRLLQDSGANLSLRDHQSDTIWHQAASAGHAKLLQSGLASSRKLVDLKNGRGRVPLHAAVPSQPSRPLPDPYDTTTPTLLASGRWVEQAC